MKLTSVGYKHIGKVFLAVGQGIILASLISMFLTGKPFSLLPAIAMGFGLVLIYAGIWYIEFSAKIEENEDKEK